MGWLLSPIGGVLMVRAQALQSEPENKGMMYGFGYRRSTGPSKG